MILRVLSLVIMLLGTVHGLYSSGMGQFIAHLGKASNFNKGGSFNDQSAGYYTAGGMMIRQGNKTVNPINIRLPSMGGSCGDFDMRFGGLSFIKAEEFANMLKAAASGVPSYALQLALKTLSPQIEGVMAHIRTVLQKLNSTMLNDCLLRQQMMAAITPSGQIHDAVCRDMEQAGRNSDYVEAVTRCRKAERRDQGIQEAKNKYKDLMMGEFNLVWQVLKLMPRYREDKELCQLIMTLTGTVVSQKEDGIYKTRFIEPKVDNENFLEAHLKGGDTMTLTCNETDKCIFPSTTAKGIAQSDSLTALLLKNISSIQSKYGTEQEFSNEEMYLLSDAINLPLYKYIQVSAGARQDWGISRSGEYIALSILIKQFEDIAAEVIDALSYLESVQMDTTLTQAFKTRLEEARSRLKERLGKVDARELLMIEKIIKIKEQELKATI